MAENIPNTPSGAVPPRPTEAAKVQPKKETVRINLPPKPTAAPTIKIPAPASTAPASAVAAAPAAPAAVHAPTHAPPTPAPRPSAAAPPGRPAPGPRSAPVMAGVSRFGQTPPHAPRLPSPGGFCLGFIRFAPGIPAVPLYF